MTVKTGNTPEIGDTLYSHQMEIKALWGLDVRQRYIKKAKFPLFCFPISFGDIPNGIFMQIAHSLVGFDSLAEYCKIPDICIRLQLRTCMGIFSRASASY